MRGRDEIENAGQKSFKSKKPAVDFSFHKPPPVSLMSQRSAVTKKSCFDFDHFC
jgi:hypothetical protein